MTYERKTGGGSGGGAPSGAAGGDLTGTYPNPTIDALKVTDAKVATANKDGTAGTASMRTLGTGAAQAAAGDHAHSGTYVPLSLIDAADDLIVGSADNTAARLAVAASRIIGKKASGAIGALTAAEVITILGITSAPATDAAQVQTSQTTASTTYADLTTTGPAVTLDVPASGEVWVELSSYLASSGSNASSHIAVAVSGATTRAADDDHAVWNTVAANFERQMGGGFLLTGLTPGSTTFTMKYRTSAGTLTAKNRNIKVTANP